MTSRRWTRGVEGLALLSASGATIATLHTAYNLTRLRRPRKGTVDEAVSVLVPARDEAHRIESCVRAVLASTGVAHLELLVFDDASVDGTADAVIRGAAGDPRLRLLRSDTDPPPGWLGKTWACAQLADAATGEALVFLDADVVLAPTGLAATVRQLRDTALDLVCPYPHQLADGLLPRLVQPLLQWSWLTLLPLGLAERSGRESLTAANGQLLACDAASYRTVGGHGAVRADVIDDISLLRAFKRNGFRGIVTDGTKVATCRMYDSGEQLVAGYTKSLWAAFGSPAGAAAVVALLGTVYVAPPLIAVGAPTSRARWLGAAGYLAAVAGRTLVARRTGQRVLPDVLAHPASVAVFGALVARSWRDKRAGNLFWRGRRLL
ncbi:MAG: glycosyltransferase [Candidatus Nanopelagicales bacterium]